MICSFSTVAWQYLVAFDEFHEQAIQVNTASLVRRPLQLLVAEVRVDVMGGPHGLLAHRVTVRRNENLEGHLAVVRLLRHFVVVPVAVSLLCRIHR